MAKILTIKQLNNLRTINIGREPWNKGLKGVQIITDYTRKIRSKLMIGNQINKGRKLTQEHKDKIGDTHRGEKSYMWKGGISRGYKTGYYSKEYKQWRMDVFKRDNFTCINCSQVGGYLTAHHIKSFAHYPKLRFELTNGVTLCEKCHKLTDNYMGRNRKNVCKNNNSNKKTSKVKKEN